MNAETSGNLRYLPNQGILPQEQVKSIWMPQCRRILRKSKRVQPPEPAPRSDRLFSLMPGGTPVPKEEHDLPLFMRESWPEEGTAVVLSPERREAASRGQMSETPVVNLAYVFSRGSILDTKISYGSA